MQQKLFCYVIHYCISLHVLAGILHDVKRNIFIIITCNIPDVINIIFFTRILYIVFMCKLN